MKDILTYSQGVQIRTQRSLHKVGRYYTGLCRLGSWQVTLRWTIMHNTPVGSHHSMGMNVSKVQETVKDRKAWHGLVHGVTKGQTRLSDWTTITNSWGRTWEPWNGFEQESEMVRSVLGRDCALAAKWRVTERTSCLSWPWHRYILPPQLPDLLLALQHHLFHDLWPLFWLQG